MARRTMRQTLLDVERAARRRGTTTALEPVDTTTCPQCKATLTVEHVAQPALVRLGGYGATRRTTRVHCADCGWSLERAVDETNPRHDLKGDARGQD